MCYIWTRISRNELASRWSIYRIKEDYEGGLNCIVNTVRVCMRGAQIGLFGKQALIQYLGCRMLIKERPWDQHLLKEENRSGEGGARGEVKLWGRVTGSLSRPHENLCR